MITIVNRYQNRLKEAKNQPLLPSIVVRNLFTILVLPVHRLEVLQMAEATGELKRGVVQT